VALAVGCHDEQPAAERCGLHVHQVAGQEHRGRSQDPLEVRSGHLAGDHAALGESRSARQEATPGSKLSVITGRGATSRGLAAGGLVARAANRHLGKSEREAAGVLSMAQRNAHFLDSQCLVQVLSCTDFRFGDLKAVLSTVFLILPPKRRATHARWLRKQ